MKRFITPGRVLGIVAVVLAMSGSAVAASKVTSAQIKDGTITGKDIKNYSVSTTKLTSSTLRDMAGPAGPAGPTGPAGPAGPSAVSQITPVQSAQVYFAGNSYAQSAVAYCPAGQRIISGGGTAIAIDGLVASQATNDRTGWFVVGGSDYYDTSQWVQAVAYCAPANGAVAASVNHHRGDAAKIASIVGSVNATRR